MIKVEKAAWFDSIVDPHSGDVPSVKSQRTEEEVIQLKAKAEIKRERKRQARLQTI